LSSPASSICLVVEEDAAGAGGGGRGSGGEIALWGEEDAYLRSGEARTQNALSVWVLRWTVFFGTQNTVCDAKWIWVVGCMLCWRMEIVLKTFYSYLSSLTKPRRVNLRFMLRAQLFLL